MKILTTDQTELPVEAQTQIERDKLFFLDKENYGKASFMRPMIEGEAIPYKPNASALVRVHARRREFYVDGHQVLVIAEPTKKEKAKPEHTPFLKNDIRSAYANIRKEMDAARPPVIKLSDEGKVERRDKERARQAERRVARQEKREGIRAVKRIEALARKAKRLQQRDDPTGVLARTFLENESALTELTHAYVPAIVPSGNGA